MNIPSWLTEGPLGAAARLLRESWDAFSEDKAPRLGAALAYFSLFSIAPLMLVLSAIAGLLLGPAIAQAHLFGLLQHPIGAAGAEAVRALAVSAARTRGGLWWNLISSALLLMGAAGVFLQLQDALNSVWGVRIKPVGTFWTAIRLQIVAVFSLLVTGGIFTGIILLSTFLTLLGRFVAGGFPFLVWQGLHFLLSVLLLTVLFALIFEWLPAVVLAWQDAWVGAAFTSVLFSLGIIFLGIYFGHANFISVYGAGSSIVLLLLWVFYSAQLLLFGAEFTKVFARHRGRPIRPNEQALPNYPEVCIAERTPSAPSLPAHHPEEPEMRRMRLLPQLGLWILFCFGISLVGFLFLLRKNPLFRGGTDGAKEPEFALT